MRNIGKTPKEFQSDLKENVKNMFVDIIQYKKQKTINKKKSNSFVSIEDEEKIPLISQNILLSMYQKYDEEFGNHLVLDIILKTFILIRNLAFKIKFYEYFLQEKDNTLNKFLKRSSLGKVQKSQSEIERMYIYHFIKQITSNIEVVDGR